MLTVQIILQVIYLLAVIGLFLNFRYGIIPWLMIMFLNPNIATNLGWIVMTQTTMNLILFSAYFFRYGMNYLTLSPIKPLVFLFLALGCMMFFETGEPIEIEFKKYVTRICQYVILPLFVYAFVRQNEENLKIVNRTFVAIAIVVLVYGFYSTNFLGFNPYLNLLKPLDVAVDYEINMGDSDFNNNGRIFGRLSSVFYHPMMCGNYLQMLMVFSLLLLDRRKWQTYLLPVLTFLFILLAGVRSTLGAVMIMSTYYVFRKFRSHYKLYFFTLCSILIVFYYVPLPQEIKNLFTSIFDSDNQVDVQGSSLSMRLEQFWGCFNLIPGMALIWGNGFYWTEYYMSVHGANAIVRAFESLVFVVLCNWGFLGVFFWVWAWMKQINFCKNHLYSVLLIISFLTYTTITGLYDYMNIFSVFFVVIYCNEERMAKKVIKDASL